MRHKILGIDLTVVPFGEAIEWLLKAATGSRTERVHFCTVHTLVEAQSDPALRDVLNTAAMVATDGLPLVWLARLEGVADAERVCGPDVLTSLCDRGRSLGLRHYFVGGRPGVPELLSDRLKARFPGLNVVGAESPPFRALTAEEDAALAARINDASPNIVWVGLGSPKQEFWAACHQEQLAVPLILPVGAAFDFHSGRVRRAPHWMQRAGLEWFFRLLMEPRRLARRYVLTNARFLSLLLLEHLRRQSNSD